MMMNHSFLEVGWDSMSIQEIMERYSLSILLDRFNAGEVPQAIKDIHDENICPLTRGKTIHLLRDAFTFPEESSNTHNVEMLIKCPNIEEVIESIRKKKDDIDSLKQTLIHLLNGVRIVPEKDKKIFEEIEILFMLLLKWTLDEQGIMKIVENSLNSISQYLQLRDTMTPVTMTTNIFPGITSDVNHETQPQTSETVNGILGFGV